MLKRPAIPFPPVAPFTPEFAASYWSKIAVSADNECWPWVHSVGNSGYGHQWHAGDCHDAHRLAILLTQGPIPRGSIVLHTCNNKLCCNPGHLKVGTASDNVRQALADGLMVKKLHPDDVRAIVRERHEGRLRIELASRYGVRVEHINRVLAGECWGAVTGIEAPHKLAPTAEQLSLFEGANG